MNVMNKVDGLEVGYNVPAAVGMDEADIQTPCLVVDLDALPDGATVGQWIAQHAPGTLNVAGPRESQSPGIGVAAAESLRRWLVGGDVG